MLSTSSDWRSRQETVNANDGLLEGTASTRKTWRRDPASGSGRVSTAHGGARLTGWARFPSAVPHRGASLQRRRRGLFPLVGHLQREPRHHGHRLRHRPGHVDDEPVPRLATEAADKADGDRVLAPRQVTVVDGWLRQPRAGQDDKGRARSWTRRAEPLLIGGKINVYIREEFSPIAPFGTVKVEFAFDASVLQNPRRSWLSRALSTKVARSPRADITRRTDGEGRAHAPRSLW